MELVFLSISGSHLYGFPNPNDVDIRGCHINSKKKYSWINKPKQTIEIIDEHKIYDYVTQEIEKFISLLLKANVNIIEQTLSPLRLFKGEYYKELQYIARECLSKKCFGHWKGFAKHTSYHAIQEQYRIPKRDLYLLRQYYQGIMLYQQDKFKSNIYDFEELDCYNKELVDELLEHKRNNTAFLSKQLFLDHCTNLEKVLDDSVKNSFVRDKPSEEAYEMAKDLLYKVRCE